jgi:hypothetical protein
MYFFDKEAEYHPKAARRIRERIEKYADYWRVRQAVDALRADRDRQQKQADDQLPDSDFAYVWPDDTGRKRRHLRLKNAAEVRTAAEWLHQYRDHMNWEDAHTIGSKILEKAGSYGTDLGPYAAFIEKQAGRGVCNPQEVVRAIHDRAKLVKWEEGRQQTEKLAEFVQNKPRQALDPTMLTSLAKSIDAVDQANGLVGKYGQALPRPEDICFKVTYKEAQASAGNACAMTSGTIYDKGELTKIGLEDLKAHFGDSFVSEVAPDGRVDPEKMAEMASTLPAPDAEVFDAIAKEAGVQPVSHKAAGDHQSLDESQLGELADAYAGVS